MKKMIRPSTLALSAAFMLGGLTALADDSSTVQLQLQNTGVDANASATVTATFKPKNSQLSINAAGLNPNDMYTLAVDGVSEATLTADNKGRIRAQFFAPAKNGNLPLNFDPNGQLVALLDGSNSVLQAIFSGPGEPTGTIVDEQVTLAALTGNGQAQLRFQEDKKGVETFRVQLKNISGPNWSLFVNGVLAGAIPTQKSSGGITFRSNGSPMLNFDPRNQVIDIVQDTNIVFSGNLEPQIPNISVAIPSANTGSIPSTGVDPDGKATARLRTDNNAVRSFSVELEDVPAGNYEFLADGVSQGFINVMTKGSETAGEIEFSSHMDETNELPLNFNPTNAIFTVQQSNVVFFQGALVLANGSSVKSSSKSGSGGGDNSGSGSGNNGGNTGATNQVPVEIRENLVATGLVPGAQGDARFEIDDQDREQFRVEIEDVPAGSYQVFVAGVQIGSINAGNNSNEVSGELEFSTHQDGSNQPLNFDPRGQLLEVAGIDGTVFSQIFGSGNTNAPASTPLDIKLPLFTLVPATNDSAEIRFKQDDRNRQSLEVKIDNAPAGYYQVLVNGVVEGAIMVSSHSGGIEFETNADNGGLPLDFNPLGADISIAQDGVVFFERVLQLN